MPTLAALSISSHLVPNPAPPVLSRAAAVLLDLVSGSSTAASSAAELEAPLTSSILARGAVLASRATSRSSGIPCNERDVRTIVALLICFVLGFVLWHLPFTRDIIAAHKLLVTGIHEASHAVVGLACGGRITWMSIDPNIGGRTQFSNLLRAEPDPFARGLPPETATQAVKSVKAIMTLVAGYMGGQVIGGVLILCAFDIPASKLASIFLALAFLAPLALISDWKPIASIVCTVGLMIGLWFVAHGEALRFFVLFTGALIESFVVNDVCDEHFFGKTESSDATQFEDLIGGPRYRCVVWALYFILLGSLVTVAAVIGGLALFSRSPAEVWKRAARFMPT